MRILYNNKLIRGISGADEGIRTPGLFLGKEACYRYTTSALELILTEVAI